MCAFWCGGNKYAVSLITKAYPEADNFDNLLLGLVRLLSHDNYRGLMNTNIALGKSFSDWFIQSLPESRNYKEATFPEYRLGQWYNGIAFGLYKQFVRFMERKGVRHRCPPYETLKDIYFAGRKELDD